MRNRRNHVFSQAAKNRSLVERNAWHFTGSKTTLHVPLGRSLLWRAVAGERPLHPGVLLAGNAYLLFIRACTLPDSALTPRTLRQPHSLASRHSPNSLPPSQPTPATTSSCVAAPSSMARAHRARHASMKLRKDDGMVLAPSALRYKTARKAGCCYVERSSRHPTSLIGPTEDNRRLAVPMTASLPCARDAALRRYSQTQCGTPCNCAIAAPFAVICSRLCNRPPVLCVQMTSSIVPASWDTLQMRPDASSSAETLQSNAARSSLCALTSLVRRLRARGKLVTAFYDRSAQIGAVAI